MAKFSGYVGYVRSVEQADNPGVFRDQAEERWYYGDFLENTRKWEEGDQINDELRMSNQISILADDFLYQNLYAMKYVCAMGCRWKITNVKLQRPRAVLSFGGVYNGPVPTGTAS